MKLIKSQGWPLSLLDELRAVGVCPCQTEVEDPGPHIEVCPNTDPNYVPPPQRPVLPARVVVFHCDVCDVVAGVARDGRAPPPPCCGRRTQAVRYARVDRVLDMLVRDREMLQRQLYDERDVTRPIPCAECAGVLVHAEPCGSFSSAAILRDR